MYMLVSNSVFNNRRQHLMQSVGEGLILLPGNEEAPMNYTDNVYPFRQDSNFLYYAGIRLPHLALLLDVDAGSAVLFGDELTIDHIVWMGAQPSLHELADAAGIAEVRAFDALASVLQQAQKTGRPIHYAPPYRGEQHIQLSQWLGCHLEQVVPNSSTRLIQAIVAQRAIKEAVEVADIERALETTGKMHRAVMQAARAGITESVLVGLAQQVAVADGGGPAYGTILTINGHVLHNHAYHHTLREGQLVLGDFGAETRYGYAGDITRTFPVSPTFTTQQREIYELVLATEMAAIDAIQPGRTYREIHLQAARQITVGLQALGLMKGDADEAVAAGAHALFFPHGLGHMLGLDVHDMEGLGENWVGYRPGMERSTQFGLRSLRLARELEPGFVLTVEPGIYFIPQLIDIWQAEGKCRDFICFDKLHAYRDFTGVRIEDNVLVTATGHRVLGNPIPKTIEAVESLRLG